MTFWTQTDVFWLENGSHESYTYIKLRRKTRKFSTDWPFLPMSSTDCLLYRKISKKRGQSVENCCNKLQKRLWPWTRNKLKHLSLAAFFCESFCLHRAIVLKHRHLIEISSFRKMTIFWTQKENFLEPTFKDYTSGNT